MNIIQQLPRIKTKSRKKRLGRGYGSGKGGHTVGRGQKGQKSRSGIGILFEGTKMKKSLIQRLPMIRGKGKMKAAPKPVILNVGRLEKLPARSKINRKLLVKEGLVSPRALQVGVKIIGNEKITKKFFVNVPISATAAKRIRAAGGEIG